MSFLSDGAVHATDMTNASRTMLYNINTLDWDHELMQLFDIPLDMMPDVKPSNADFGSLSNVKIFLFVVSWVISKLLYLVKAVLIQEKAKVLMELVASL